MTPARELSDSGDARQDGRCRDAAGERADAAAAGERPDADAGSETTPRIRRTGRRVRTEPTPGYIGEPAVERGSNDTENDDRLRQDKPPHWG